MKHRFAHLALLAACTSMGPLSLNLYLPSVPAVQAHFGASVAEVQTTVSLALLGFGLGLILLGPLTDRYGRRPCLIGGLALFIAASLLGGIAPSLGWLAAARVLQAVGCAMAFISSRAIVADLSPGESLARSVAQMTMLILVVQSVAPLMGTALMALGGWRSVHFFGAALAIVLVTCVVLWQRETLPAERSVQRGGSISGFLRPTFSLLGRPGMAMMLVQVGLLYSAYPAFVSIAPQLMVDALGRSPAEFAYYFFLLPLGYFAGNAFVLRYGKDFGQHRLVPAGTLFALGSALLGVLLFALRLRHPLVLFLPAGALLNFGLGLALPTVSARAVTLSSPEVGSGWGLVGCSQQVIAALAVQIVGHFSTASAYPVLFVCAGALMIVLALEHRRRDAAPAVGSGR